MKRKIQADKEDDHIGLSDQERRELGKLEARLMSFSKKEIRIPEKEKLKQHIFAVIRDKEKEQLPYRLKLLAERIKKVGLSILMPDWARVMMKERILDYAYSSADFRGAQIKENLYSMYRKLAAAALLVVFAVTVVVVFPVKPNVTYAKSTYLDSVSGEVYIKRKVEMFKAEPRMPVEEGDVVLTKGQSAATIRFFDDSISRMSENTTVQVNRLYNEPLNPVVTTVELYLQEGRLWGNVVSLVDDSRFIVDTGDFRTDVRKKAAFDINVDDESAELSVYDNMVTVASVNDLKDSNKTVIAGYKAELSQGSMEKIKVKKLPRNEVLNPQSDWIVSNLTSDQEYEDLLVQDKEEDLAFEEEEIKAASKALSLPGADDKKDEFIAAYEVLLDAQAKLVGGDKQGGNDGLEEFSKSAKEIISYLRDLEKSDPAAAEYLRNFINEKVSLQLKDMASFLPDNKLYKAKEVLQEVELEMASSEVERAEIQLEQAGSILLEIEELVANNQSQLASTLLKRYKNRTNGITLTLTDDNIKELKERFVPIIKGQAEHMKTLTALENSIIYLDHRDLKEKVMEARGDTLRKFVTALEKMPESVPDDVLYDVMDLYETYIDDGEDETDIIEPAFEKLAEGQKKGVTFISPSENIPSEMGIFVMVPIEGTADVKAEPNLSHVEKWAGKSEARDD